MGLCWCPPASSSDSKERIARLASALRRFNFEVLIVPSQRPEAISAATSLVDVAAKELQWELELSTLPCQAGLDEKSLQDAYHSVYTDRCVAAEQSCLLLLSNREEAWSWLSTFTNWFLGKEPLELSDEEQIWLAVELNGFTLAGSSPGLKLRSKTSEMRAAVT
ncbi:unnamed protein product [Symbiodinium natans]|uniref:Uncharacterized protein n=1 Tax=Symbiodinium natans TaxID=878477 RepID=A0A812S5F6_9DINO|nr:unnamed protein product [Symbiodinium natans]